MNDLVERIETPNHASVPLVSLDIHHAEGVPDDVAELLEPSDDDETGRALLGACGAFQLAPPALRRQAGLSASSADRPLTPFRLRVFSTRGSPSA